MRIIGVIPARYASSRFPGKPLADIHGKPMIVRVYERTIKSTVLNSVCVATDNKLIFDVCEEHGISVLMTDSGIAHMTGRVHAVSLQIEADAYYCIPGDEPLVDYTAIDAVAGAFIRNPNYDVVHAVSEIVDATEVIDYTNLKVVANNQGEALYISRSPIPYPKGTLDFNYLKLVCGGVFSKEGLEFFNSKQKGKLETAEDCDIVRFIENGRKVLLVPVEGKTLSVDTPKDLERVRTLFS